VLRTQGRQQRKALCAAYNRGSRHFVFKPAVYGHPQVKEALRRAQHGKCAFCESKVLHTEPGDVEHFRPKAGSRQSERQPLECPGYYWLAYEWQNLFLACTLCNRQFKRNLFPLKKPRQRARSHRVSIAKESPMLIDPAREEPEAFMSYEEERPVAVNGHPRGEATIRVMDLRREALSEERRKRLIIARALLKAVQIGGEAAADQRALLRSFQNDDEPYAAMIRALLRKNAPGLLDEAHRETSRSPVARRPKSR
jgi:uncharacterized protein (TIGR02646 family)